MSQDSPEESDLPAVDRSARADLTGVGLSNDYLNHYAEVLMLIELAPNDASLGSALADWWPISYIDYFISSRLDHAAQARAAYEALPDEARGRFEKLVAVMETLATMAVFALQPPCEPERASVVADKTAPVLRRLIASASAFLNSTGRNVPEVLPIDEAERVINAIIGTGLTLAESSDAPSEPAEDGPDKSIRILVVEDDALLRDLFRKALRRAGYQVLTADNGEKALAVLREWGDQIDWLFTDIRLPGVIDGWVVGSEFGLNHPLRPVVYGSGFEPNASRQVANSVFMRKPVNVGELVATFKRLSWEYSRLT